MTRSIRPPACGTTRARSLGGRAHAPARQRARRVLPGLANPLGLKAGPQITPDELLTLCDLLNPGNEPGRLTVIARMGHDQVERRLPLLIRAARREGRNLVWACDPMHGNTIESSSGYKTRPFDRILAEVRASSRCTRRKAPMPAACTSR